MEYFIAILALLQAIFCFRLIGPQRKRAVAAIYFEIIYNLIIKFLIGNAGLPGPLNYLSDVVLLWLAAEYLLEFRGRKIPRSLLLCAGLLLGVSLVSWGLNRYSPLLYLWGLRINFRFLLFAMFCAVYLEKRDIRILMNILFGFFLTNVAVVTYQFLFVHYDAWSPGDFMSGLFSNGLERGGNASLSWLICIVCTFETLIYLQSDNRPWRLIACWIGAVCMASFAEIKLVFLQLAMIAGLALLLGKKSRRSLWVLLLSGASIFLGIQMLYLIFPEFSNFFQPDSMADYVTRDDLFSGAAAGGLNRLTAIPYVLEHFLIDWPRKLFGIGLGNGEVSSFSFLTSDFYRQHQELNYTFFSSAMVTLELGLVGLAVYCGWFFNLLCHAFFWKPVRQEGTVVRQMCVILGLMVYVMLLSNQTMKIETTAYLVNCVLIFPFLIKKEEVPASAQADSLPR